MFIIHIWISRMKTIYILVGNSIIVLQKTRVFLFKLFKRKKLKYFKLFHKTNGIAKISGVFYLPYKRWNLPRVLQSSSSSKQAVQAMKLWNISSFSVSISVGRKFKFFYWWHSGFEVMQSWFLDHTGLPKVQAFVSKLCKLWEFKTLQFISLSELIVFSEASYLGYKLVISKTKSVHEKFF